MRGMARRRPTSSWLRGARIALAALLLAGLIGGAAGHHDPLESAVHGASVGFTVSTSATHAGSASHVEASGTERHEACTVCLLQRQAGFTALPLQTFAARIASGEAQRPDRFALRARRPVGADRGRAPPLA